MLEIRESDRIGKKKDKKHENETQRTVKRPGDVQVGSFRAEKMLNDDSSDNFEPLAISIDVGGGPSGPSIEGPFCRTVRVCRTLGDRKIEKKITKKRKK